MSRRPRGLTLTRHWPDGRETFTPGMTPGRVRFLVVDCLNLNAGIPRPAATVFSAEVTRAPFGTRVDHPSTGFGFTVTRDPRAGRTTPAP